MGDMCGTMCLGAPVGGVASGEEWRDSGSSRVVGDTCERWLQGDEDEGSDGVIFALGVRNVPVGTL